MAKKLSVIFVVLNDGALGMVKHGQRLAKAEPVGFAIPPVDFALMAKAMGADSYTIYQRSDFDQIDFEAMCTRQGPTLLDVHVDPEEVPLIGMRIKTLKGS